MKNNDFLKLISSEKPLLADGAMGTLLHERGISFDACFDALNLSDPTHRSFLPIHLAQTHISWENTGWLTSCTRLILPVLN
jgi:methionine synthase I (cobalamin-dependent)